MKYSLIFSKRAQCDLNDIMDYFVNEINNPIVAEKIIHDIFDKCYSLLTFPNFFRVRYKFKGCEYRLAHSRGYIIAYQVDRKNYNIEISTIVHSKRNITKRLRGTF